MKIRNGFVSNSSSASFIILLDRITDEQKQMVYNHIEIGQEIDKKLIAKGKPSMYEYYDEWLLKEDEFSLWCSTTMDNFDLEFFIKREVNISKKAIIDIGDGWGYNLYNDEDYIKLKTAYLRKKKLTKIKSKIEK